MKKNFKLDKTSYIKYHFSETDNKEPYFSVEISIEKIRNIFDMLKENFGETETIKDYSIYKHNNTILTVYPDGSSFCNQIDSHYIKDPNFSKGILVSYNEKYKISNDIFPCKFNYDSIVDIIDIIFTVNKDIKIVLSSNYENNKTFEKVKNIESLGRPNMTKSKNAWCELYIIVDCNSAVEEVHNTIHMLSSFFPMITTC